MAPLVALDDTFGALYIGVTMSAVLFGATSMQVMWFFQRFPEDSGFSKFIVALLWLLDAMILALCIHVIYYYFVSTYGDSMALLNPVWSIQAQNMISNLVISLVQSMYCFRIWKISGDNKIIPAISTVGIVVAWSAGLLNSIGVYRLRDFDEIHRVNYIIDIPLCSAAAVDIILAASLLHYIRRSKGHFAVMKSILNRLTLTVMGTGMLTSAVAVSSLFCFIAMPRNLVFLGLEVFLSKLYTNSFLAMLNSRQSLRLRHLCVNCSGDYLIHTLEETSDSHRSEIRDPRHVIRVHHSTWPFKNHVDEMHMAAGSEHSISVYS